MLRINNTLGRKTEEFTPITKDKVTIYRCGPTVYWTQHIGNMRGMVMSDLIVRTLKYLGYNTIQARNYTDVGHLISDDDEGEDKMEKGAKREGLTPEQIADKYIQQFENDVKALNILDPEFKPRATEFIQQMIEMVQTLLDKGYAYSTEKAIYFDVSKFPKYNELNGQKIEKNIEGEGHGETTDLESKRNPQDFVIWFFKTGVHKNALQYWTSPFHSTAVENGEGFPGWHLECSAMANSLLGATVDIHIGGIEHIPVHHTNEIAQSEGSSGEKFVNYWLHHEHLLVDGEKMSKSTENIYSLDTIVEKGYKPMHLRYLFLQSQYRSKQNFTFEALDGARNAYERLVKLMKDWNSESDELSKLDEKFENKIENFKSDLRNYKINKDFKEKFTESLEEDFNIPKALAIVWEVAKADIQPDDKIGTILDFDRVLGLGLEEALVSQKNDEIPQEAQELIAKRNVARENKDWTTADQIRDELKEKFGLEISDK